jgi:hypothetical protein
VRVANVHATAPSPIAPGMPALASTEAADSKAMADSLTWTFPVGTKR